MTLSPVKVRLLRYSPIQSEHITSTEAHYSKCLQSNNLMNNEYEAVLMAKFIYKRCVFREVKLEEPNISFCELLTMNGAQKANESRGAVVPGCMYHRYVSQTCITARGE